MKHRREWVALAVAASFAACTRTPTKNGSGNGGVPSSLGGSVGGTGGGSTTSASGGTLGNGGATSTVRCTQATVSGLQGVFVPTGSPSVTRTDHTATLLPNGMVLIAGGNRDVGASAELYDPCTGIFTATGSVGRGKE